MAHQALKGAEDAIKLKGQGGRRQDPYCPRRLKTSRDEKADSLIRKMAQIFGWNMVGEDFLRLSPLGDY